LKVVLEKEIYVQTFLEALELLLLRQIEWEEDGSNVT
jgi:hypothetical protein